MLGPGQLLWGHSPPFPVRSNPQLRVHLVLGDDFALHDVTVEEVVVHRVGDDLSHRRRVELDETVVLGLAGL